MISRSSAGAQGDWRRVWYVYFLQLNNGDIYVGSTNDLKRRLSSHQAGHVLSTKAYLPVLLRSYVAVEEELALVRFSPSFGGECLHSLRRFKRIGTLLNGKQEALRSFSEGGILEFDLL